MKSAKNYVERYRKGLWLSPGGQRALAVGLALTMTLTAEPAFAQANVESMAQSILDLLTGTLAKTVATIAFVIVGYSYWLGKAGLQLLVSVAVGCFIVFGANWLVNLVAG